MNLLPEKYVLDANVFIQAHRRFYPFDVCPGYWQAMCWYRAAGRVCSVDKVLEELEDGKDVLCEWVKVSFGVESFRNTDAVVEQYSEMAVWVQQQNQFRPTAKAEFMEVADGWLSAFAKANGTVLVTLEEHNPDAKGKVPLVNVCRAFGVETITPFVMLRRLGIKLDWQPPPVPVLSSLSQ